MIDTPEVTFSLIRGIRFTFTDPGYEIEFRGSAWTGKESVFVDGNSVSEKRSFSKSTVHNFELANSNYAVTYSTKSITGGGWSCTLTRDGEIVKQFDIFMKGGNKYVGWASIVLGSIFGTLFVKFPDSLIYIVPLFILTLFILNKFRRSIVLEMHGDT